MENIVDARQANARKETVSGSKSGVKMHGKVYRSVFLSEIADWSQLESEHVKVRYLEQRPNHYGFLISIFFA